MPPEFFEELAKAAQKMKMDALCDVEELPSISGQHFYLALAALDVAMAQFKLAQVWTMRRE